MTVLGTLFSALGWSFAGIGLFIQNKINPESIRQQLEVTRDLYIGKGWDAQLIDQSFSMTEQLMLNPLFVVIMGVGSMLIYGGLMGLIVSLFVRRKSTGSPTSAND